MAGPLIISEFRLRGPNGANDEFIEIYNPDNTPHVVTGGGTGYAVAASDGVARFVIPNGTVIPPHGHFLGVNSVGYSLASNPAGNGTTATGDATYTTDIPDNAGIALFNTSVAVDFTLVNRMDAVGSTSEANTLYKEGAGYAALTPFSIDYSFQRDACGKGGSISNFAGCTAAGVPLDTNTNASDFVFVDTNGTSAGAGQRLGAPGPENLSGPTTVGATIGHAALDSCSSPYTGPNLIRDFTSDPANNSTFGTLDLRQTFTNNTGGALTRLRFRIVDLTTFPAPSGIADLRPRSSTAVVVTVDRAPCGSATSNVTVQGTTLEQPPSQPNGGGFNSSMSVGTVTLATPLASGDSVDVRLLLGIQQTGSFRIALVPETLPAAGIDVGVLEFCGNTEGGVCPGAPTATAVSVSGTAEVGSTLTGAYTYSDAESDPQGTSTFRWMSDTQSSGATKVAIGAATATTYSPVAGDAGKYLFFCVTPVATTGVSPGTEVCSSATAAVLADDGDGLPPGTEGGVTNQSGVANGDGNSDGTPDGQQSYVTSLPTAVGGAYGTLVSISQKPLNTVSAIAAPPGLPPSANVPFGAFQFTATGVANNAVEAFELYVPYDPTINAALKLNRFTSQWENVATSITKVGNKTKITFSVQNGGPYDADGSGTNGQITDPIVPVAMAMTTAIPTLSEWGMIILSSLMALGAVLTARRRTH